MSIRSTGSGLRVNGARSWHLQEASARVRLRPNPCALFAIVGIAVASFLGGCTTTVPLKNNKTDSFGLTEGQKGYVPARTAVLPCHSWPESARYSGYPKTDLSDETTQRLCTDFDDVVVKSFTNQPYVRGYSPSFVLKILKAKNKLDLIGDIGAAWTTQKDIQNLPIRGPVDYYKLAVQPNVRWREQLQELANNVKGVDAVLLPLLISGRNSRRDERGVIVYERTASVLALLINTANGELIWTGGRKASASRQHFKGQSGGKFPDWQQVAERLFVNSLWRDYPGRIES